MDYETNVEGKLTLLQLSIETASEIPSMGGFEIVAPPGFTFRTGCDLGAPAIVKEGHKPLPAGAECLIFGTVRRELVAADGGSVHEGPWAEAGGLVEGENGFMVEDLSLSETTARLAAEIYSSSSSSRSLQGSNRVVLRIGHRTKILPPERYQFQISAQTPTATPLTAGGGACGFSSCWSFEGREHQGDTSINVQVVSK